MSGNVAGWECHKRHLRPMHSYRYVVLNLHISYCINEVSSEEEVWPWLRVRHYG